MDSHNRANSGKICRILLKNQLRELFSGYFVSKKTGKARSKSATVLYFLFFIILMVGLLGGIFTYVSVQLCAPLSALGYGWLYYDIMVLISVALGVFGSVFNTFSLLYKAKDNELLLSMPVPTKSIIMARVGAVLSMSVLYSAVVFIPAIIVYWVFAAHGPLEIISGIVMLVLISVFTLTLSIALGWLVARISLRLKNKSVATAFASLAFLAIYYVVYFKANAIINDIISNCIIYGEAIKGKALVFYYLGKACEGSLLSLLVITLIVALLFLLSFRIVNRSFIGMATHVSGESKVKYVEKKANRRSIDKALFDKEMGRFLGSSTYMVNCGLGSVITIAAAIFAVIKASLLRDSLMRFFMGDEGFVAVVVCAGIFAILSLNTISSASISIEGKTIWIAHSLPVDPWRVLKAKLRLHILFSLVPIMILSIVLVLIFDFSMKLKILVLLITLAYSLFGAYTGLITNLKMANLNWTNETVAVKQNMGVLVDLFGGWLIAFGMFMIRLMVFDEADISVYLGIWLAMIVLIDVISRIWLKRKGSVRFSSL